MKCFPNIDFSFKEKVWGLCFGLETTLSVMRYPFENKQYLQELVVICKTLVGPCLTISLFPCWFFSIKIKSWIPFFFVENDSLVDEIPIYKQSEPLLVDIRVIKVSKNYSMLSKFVSYCWKNVHRLQFGLEMTPSWWDAHL